MDVCLVIGGTVKVFHTTAPLELALNLEIQDQLKAYLACYLD